MVAPIILTGVFQAIAKTKKASWKAMEGAMTSVKGAAGPMGSIANSFKVFAPIVKTVNALFKVLGASILKTLMPALIPLLAMLTSPVMLALMEDIGKIIGVVLIPIFGILTTVLKIVAPILKQVTQFFLENEWALKALILVLSPLLFILKNLTGIWDFVCTSLKTVGNAFIWFINMVIGGINILMNAITFGLWGDIPKIPSLQFGIDSVPRTGPYLLHKDETVISAGKRAKGEIHVHIDLRNAVVDNVDRLSQKIAEAVLIQIG
jgi:hypothetical protein